jgi:hypothetical protein
LKLIKQSIAFLLLLSAIFTVGNIVELGDKSTVAYAWVSATPKTAESYEGRPDNNNDGQPDTIGSPTVITFTKGYKDANGVQSPQYAFYGSSKKFYETFHYNRYHWYSITPPKFPTADDLYYFHMLEDLQTSDGAGGKQMVNESYSLNLKLGRDDPITGRGSSTSPNKT